MTCHSLKRSDGPSVVAGIDKKWLAVFHQAQIGKRSPRQPIVRFVERRGTTKTVCVSHPYVGLLNRWRLCSLTCKAARQPRNTQTTRTIRNCFLENLKITCIWRISRSIPIQSSPKPRNFLQSVSKQAQSRSIKVPLPPTQLGDWSGKSSNTLPASQ